ncbi:leukocyte elastase inhibitor isoform X7 [Misgurnus anguillicaudatus]|uniref:leukocyte elastase inhibitor isoform X7 n=1 Tax=Misgurnus anguillicaudatus TaxID=75329 RepID=UPI003CCF23CE
MTLFLYTMDSRPILSNNTICNESFCISLSLTFTFVQVVKMESLSAANTQFSLNVFKKISEINTSGKNVFYSPLSISSALAMVSLGAKGNTKDQILQVLCLNKSGPDTETADQQEDLIHSSYNKLMSELNEPGVPYMLSLANRLYGEKSYQFIGKFITDSQKYYQAGLESVDFIKNSEAARVNINNWVEKKTQGKIKDLVAVGFLNDSTRLVLVNALYFKGTWEKIFLKEDTVDQQFKVNKNETKPVKMMNQTSHCSLAFIPEVNSQILELSYIGRNLSMLIILPNEIEDDTTGLQKLEKTLTYEKLMEWTKSDNMTSDKVEISLPQFKLEETYDMKNLLVKLGMVDAFQKGKANFSGMSSKNDLVVSEVIHKSFVEVNEEGTEAAAATGIVMMTCSMYYTPPKIFNADHPFLFFIRHNLTNTILFYGRFCSP